MTHIYTLQELINIRDEFEKRNAGKQDKNYRFDTPLVKQFMEENNVKKEQFRLAFSNNASINMVKKLTGIQVEKIICDNIKYDYLAEFIGQIVKQGIREKDQDFFYNKNTWLFRLTNINGKAIYVKLSNQK